MSITLEEANMVIKGATKMANEQGTKMNVAVCDSGGRLVAFARMNGAMWAGAYGSQGKAVASAATGKKSGELQEQADSSIWRGVQSAEGGHMILSLGGVPILRDGLLIGACGVGGGTGQEDEDCAAAGVATLGS